MSTPLEPLLYTVFHLNLAFSSIEKSERPTVVERCYWPILRLANEFPIGIEATGYTLHAIEAIDADWIRELARLIKAGKVEFVGSGAAQVIGPLVAPEVTRKNLELGNRDYQDLLGVQPTLALVNEQAYAPSLLPLYADAGYKAVMMDWAEASSHHPEWPADLVARPQMVAGGGVELPVVWSDAISFQKFQRYAHGELSADEYFEFLLLQFQKGVKALPLYTSDGEVFDYRPGRFGTEAELSVNLEYDRINLLMQATANSGAAKLVLPSESLQVLDPNVAPISVETAMAPVTVKKQRKYNLLRWAATGHNDLAINTHCWRMLDALKAKEDASDDEWRTLIEAWASDYRTHITAKRWNAFQDTLQPLPARPTPENAARADVPDDIDIAFDGRFYTIHMSGRHLVLSARRGLAVQALGTGDYAGAVAGAPGPNSPVGTLAHGFYDDITYGADFYTGHMVFEPHDSHKVSDLNRCEPQHWYDAARRALVFEAKIDTARGPITKTVRWYWDTGRLEYEYDFSWPERQWGSLRLAHVTLNPRAFDARTLYFASHNGGELLERHSLWHEDGLMAFDHGRPVSKLVSASTGLGMTGGEILLGDSRRAVRLTMDRSDAAGIGMVAVQPVKDSFFVRALISLQETDETAKLAPEPLSPVVEPPRIRFAIELV